MTLPHTRHLDALVAKYVLKLEDVRLGWAFGSDAQPQWSSDRDYYGRDYIYRAREATETGAGYERVPGYASDGNAMLGLESTLDQQDTWIVHADNWSSCGGDKRHIVLSTGIYKMTGGGLTFPLALVWASLNLTECVKRASGDQSFDVRRELQRLEDAYQEAINEKGVEHA